MSLWNLYVGTFTGDFEWLTGKPSQGIEHLTFDDDNGSVAWLETIPGVSSPQYLELHPELAMLYAAEFAHPGTVIDFAIRGDGSLERRSTTGSIGELAVAVSIHPGCDYAYVANWGNGTLAQLRLDESGGVSGVEPIAQLERRDPRDEPEHPAHPHQIRPTPSGNGVLVAYAGLDELTAYVPDRDGKLPSPPTVRIEFPPDSAPRHIEFHPSGRFVYVVGERDSRLYVLEAEDGVPTRILNSYSTLPPGYEGTNAPSELDLHPDGKALYIGNRGSDCLTIVSLGSEGAVEIVGHQASMGRGPRAVRVDPSSQYLLVGNVDSCDVAVFQIDDDRRLTPVGTPVEVPSPSSFVFVRA